MSLEPQLELVDADLARAAATRLFDATKVRLAQLLPLGAEILHVGATAIPGCLTKGDLDVVVRVPSSQFAMADRFLSSVYARNHGSVRNEYFSAFEDASSSPHLGVQLVVIDGPFDFFHFFVEKLRQSSELVRKYNDLKLRWEGLDMASYRAAKDEFIKGVLGAGEN